VDNQLFFYSSKTKISKKYILDLVIMSFVSPNWQKRQDYILNKRVFNHPNIDENYEDISKECKKLIAISDLVLSAKFKNTLKIDGMFFIFIFIFFNIILY
jgi:hypothetical protein